MNIAQYINELLIDNDCVIIPGFGGFVTNYQSAMVSGNAHVHFMPPSKLLSFNVKLNQNDGLLISKISTILQISYKQAEEQVADFVHNIKKQLHQTGSYPIEGIGIILLNANSSIAFEPTVDTNLFADSFGLSSFMFPQLNYGIRAKQHVSFRQSAPKRHIYVTKTLKRVAVAVPMILLLAILPTLYLRNFQESTLSFYKTAKTEKATEVIQNKTKVNHFAQKRELKIAQTTSYHIIIGCFRNCKKAQELTESCKTNGYKATVIPVNDLFKVSLQTYNDISEANDALISFQDANPQFADAWIMKE